MRNYRLTLRCNNRPGIVAAVASRLAAHGGDITEAQQYDDRESGNFFMRVEFSMAEPIEDFERRFVEEVERFGLETTVRSVDERRKMAILVSKFDHCLVDLLYRIGIGELQVDLVGIISNHPADALSSPLNPAIPYFHLPIGPDTKALQEARLKAVLEQTGAELVVLARYMQVLTDGLSSYLAGRCINIHHSFLPGFKGAKPYHQAHERGVKMIGATAHYVTPDLDEGPIISQDVEHVTHADTPEDLVRKGRDIERRVLARAVTYHIQDRVMLNGRKTVIFS